MSMKIARPKTMKPMARKLESRVPAIRRFLLILDASHHPRADPTRAWATTDGSTPNADATTYLRRLGSRRPFCNGCLSERILSKTRTVKVQHEMISRIAATNGKANGSWCVETKETVSTSIKTALATPIETAARPMKAETSVRAIVVSLPRIVLLRWRLCGHKYPTVLLRSFRGQSGSLT